MTRDGACANLDEFDTEGDGKNPILNYQQASEVEENKRLVPLVVAFKRV